MSLIVSEDLKDLIMKFNQHRQVEIDYTHLENTINEKDKVITLLQQEVSEARKSENRMFSKIQRCQENISELQQIITNLTIVKEENEKLKKEIKSLEEEKQNFRVCEEKWNSDKEAMVKSNREEIENMKKIRNMEAISLNREISRIQEEGHQKVEALKREFQKVENDYSDRLSKQASEYEERLSAVNRELISARTEVNNLRNLTPQNGLLQYSVEVTQPKSERYIPQPLTLPRYKPLPVLSSASQFFTNAEGIGGTSEGTKEAEDGSLEGILQGRRSSGGKKRKLYSRMDDSLYL